MSVESLSTGTCTVVSQTITKDAFGAAVATYNVKYTNIPCRVCYNNGKQTLQAGKLQVVPDYIVYIQDATLDITESDKIIDNLGRQLDLLHCNNLYNRHYRILAKNVTSLIDFNDLDTYLVVHNGDYVTSNGVYVVNTQ